MRQTLLNVIAPMSGDMEKALHATEEDSCIYICVGARVYCTVTLSA